ncbi:MAG TPA: hypothetical protein VFO79_03405 [Xanthomonadales bacterium]|nr:hypothetical protein [Xanthomonadales bacterium]
MSIARLLTLLFSICLVAQPALAQLVPACLHATAPADGHAGHHGHHDTKPNDEAPSGGCDCGCACADFACAHVTVAPAIPASPQSTRLALAALPSPPRTASGTPQAAPDMLLRPPNHA